MLKGLGEKKAEGGRGTGCSVPTRSEPPRHGRERPRQNRSGVAEFKGYGSRKVKGCQE